MHYSSLSVFLHYSKCFHSIPNMNERALLNVITFLLGELSALQVAFESANKFLRMIRENEKIMVKSSSHHWTMKCNKASGEYRRRVIETQQRRRLIKSFAEQSRQTYHTQPSHKKRSNSIKKELTVIKVVEKVPLHYELPSAINYWNITILYQVLLGFPFLIFVVLTLTEPRMLLI